MKKKLIFFDGDGTLWYPKNTKHTIAPQWVYSDKNIGSDYLKHIVVIPQVLNVLKELKKKGIILVLLSAHPYSSKAGKVALKGKIEHFKLTDFFDTYHASRTHPDEKGKIMVNILKEKHTPKSKALMIGDSYRYDYLSARKVGVDALLIKTDYTKHPARGPKVSKTIKSITEVLDFI